MSDHLDDAQTELLATYQSITGEENTTRSIRQLRSHNWNLNDAVQASMNQSYSSPTPPPVVNHNHNHNHNHNNHNHNPLQAQRRPVPLLFWPFTFLYRLLARPLSFGTSIITGILRFGFNIIGSLIPFSAGRRGDDADPTTTTTRFLQQFETTYGNTHPHFLTTPYSQAVARAKAECKFLFVYIHCESNQNTPQFCRNTLCTEVLSDFVNDSFVSWAGNVRNGHGYQVSNMLGATTYPFIAVVCCNPIPGYTSGNNITIVDKIEGVNIPPSELIARLSQTLETFGQILTNNREERQQRETDRQIREEQDAAYLQSLAEDQEKERKREEEERLLREEQERLEEEERQRQELEEQRTRAREAKRLSLAHEPRDDDKESVKLTIRLPDGARVSRRFHMNDDVQTVLDYIDVSHGLPADNYVLVSSYPKQVYSQVRQTLKEAQLYPQPAALFVQEKQ